MGFFGLGLLAGALQHLGGSSSGSEASRFHKRNASTPSSFDLSGFQLVILFVRPLLLPTFVFSQMGHAPEFFGLGNFPHKNTAGLWVSGFGDSDFEFQAAAGERVWDVGVGFCWQFLRYFALLSWASPHY